jgi:hypothetical protein
MTRTIAAPLTQTLNGKVYDFVGWSDGKAIRHTIDTPATNTTYTATYREVAVRSFRATADATVRDGSYAAQNFGNALSIDVKKSTTSFNRWTYLRFDIGSAAAVSTARLRLYGALNNTEAKNIPIDVFGVSSTTWGETAINWNNKPATGTTSLGRFTVLDTTARWYEVDISKYIRDEKAAGRNVISIALKSAVSATPLAVFNSDENALNKPSLIVHVPVTTAAATVAMAVRPITETSAAPAASLWAELSEESPSDLA